jgi:hypothetical protein
MILAESLGLDFGAFSFVVGETLRKVPRDMYNLFITEIYPL